MDRVVSAAFDDRRLAAEALKPRLGGRDQSREGEDAGGEQHSRQHLNALPRSADSRIAARMPRQSRLWWRFGQMPEALDGMPEFRADGMPYRARRRGPGRRRAGRCRCRRPAGPGRPSRAGRRCRRGRGASSLRCRRSACRARASPRDPRPSSRCSPGCRATGAARPGPPIVALTPGLKREKEALSRPAPPSKRSPSHGSPPTRRSLPAPPISVLWPLLYGVGMSVRAPIRPSSPAPPSSRSGSSSSPASRMSSPLPPSGRRIRPTIDPHLDPPRNVVRRDRHRVVSAGGVDQDQADVVLRGGLRAAASAGSRSGWSAGAERSASSTTYSLPSRTTEIAFAESVPWMLRVTSPSRLSLRTTPSRSWR